MPLNEKRKVYACGSGYIPLERIPTWMKDCQNNPSGEGSDLSKRVSLFRGDITKPEIGGIVNAANKGLRGGGGVDGAIHRAAGDELKIESGALAPCDTGHAVITGGYRLPAKYVIHTVGPVGEHPNRLASCYKQSLQRAVENDAFPCISTGVYGYPNEPAAHVALATCQEFLKADREEKRIERIILCVFVPKNEDIYRRLMGDCLKLPLDDIWYLQD